MQVRADQLGSHLAGTLEPVYLVHGDDPLLTMEACQAVRDAARAQGYSEREYYTADKGFDWFRLGNASRSLSLFAERRVIEVRLPTGKPGSAGGEVLMQLAANAGTDTIVLVWSARLDKKTQATKWVKALDQAGVSVAVYALSPRELPAWIVRRMKAHDLIPGAGVAEMLAYRYEGNLLALSQEIEKLVMLFGQGEVSLKDIDTSVADSARFDVYRLVDSCLQGDGSAAIRILHALRAEGVAPVLVSWALVREIRSLASMAIELAGGGQETSLFRVHRVWPARHSMVRSALKRHSRARWLALLQGAHRADRVIKGRETGDAWQALSALGLALAGVRFPSVRRT